MEEKWKRRKGRKWKEHGREKERNAREMETNGRAMGENELGTILEEMDIIGKMIEGHVNKLRETDTIMERIGREMQRHGKLQRNARFSVSSTICFHIICSCLSICLPIVSMSLSFVLHFLQSLSISA